MLQLDFHSPCLLLVKINICGTSETKIDSGHVTVVVGGKLFKIGFQVVVLCIRWQIRTASLDTIFIQIYMDTLSGVPGVSKNQFLLQMKLLSCCQNCPQKAQTSKIEKKALFSQSISNILQYLRTKSLIACLVDPAV